MFVLGSLTLWRRASWFLPALYTRMCSIVFTTCGVWIPIYNVCNNYVRQLLYELIKQSPSPTIKAHRPTNYMRRVGRYKLVPLVEQTPGSSNWETIIVIVVSWTWAEQRAMVDPVKCEIRSWCDQIELSLSSKQTSLYVESHDLFLYCTAPGAKEEALSWGFQSVIVFKFKYA